MTFTSTNAWPRAVSDPETGFIITRRDGPDKEDLSFHIKGPDNDFIIFFTVKHNPDKIQADNNINLWLSLEGFNWSMVRIGKLCRNENNKLLVYIIRGVRAYLTIYPYFTKEISIWTNNTIEVAAEKLKIPIVVDIPAAETL